MCSCWPPVGYPTAKAYSPGLQPSTQDCISTTPGGQPSAIPGSRLRQNTDCRAVAILGNCSPSRAAKSVFCRLRVNPFPGFQNKTHDLRQQVMGHLKLIVVQRETV